jgi:hypothetical protein
MELKFRLPNDESSLFEALFFEMEENRDKHGIQSFGISLTTMEEVYLKVAVGIDHHNPPNKHHPNIDSHHSHSIAEIHPKTGQEKKQQDDEEYYDDPRVANIVLPNAKKVPMD